MMQIHRKNSSRIIDQLVLWTGFTLLFMSVSLPLSTAYPVCYGRLDLMFVVDASYSIEDPDFTVICEFVAQAFSDILGDLKDQLRASYIMYASTVYEDQLITLESYTQADFVPLLKTSTRNSRNIKTNTGIALERALSIYLAQRDPDAITFVVLITDGQADDQQKAYDAAQQLKDNGAFILAVGIGNIETIDLNELQIIASSIGNAVIRDKDAINDEFLYFAKKMICSETLFRKTDPEILRSSVPIDVYFLLDESQNVLSLDFVIVKDFIKAIMQRLEISDTTARVGVITFGETSRSGASQYIRLGSRDSEDKLFSAIERLNLNLFNADGRNVLSGFDRLEADIAANGDDSRRVVIVLVTTGLADGGEAAIQKAQAIQAVSPPNKYLLILGIGHESVAWESERNQMAYDTGSVFHTGSFLGISGNDEESVNLIDSIRQKIIELATFIPAGEDRWSENFDIVFLIDGSKQMVPAVHFAIAKFLVKELIDEFELGPDAGRVAVLIYDAAGWYNIIQFTDYSDRDDLYTTLDNLLLIQRTEFADNAVGLDALWQYFQVHGRESANQLGYVITTSASPDALHAEAQAKRLAADGVQLIVLGIGSEVSSEELNSMEVFVANGGPVTLSSLASVASTATLDELKAELEIYADPALKRPHGLYFPWNSKFDLIAMVHDGAGYVDGGIGAKNFLIDLFQRYWIGPDGVRVGVVNFGAGLNTGSNRQILLGSNDYLGSLLINTLNLDLTPTGGVNVNAAMAATRVMFENYGRPNVPQMAILVMEGNIILDDVLASVQAVKDAGISIATVGVGLGTDVIDMQTIAHNEELAFMMGGWNSMDITPLMDANLVALSRNQFEPSQGIGDILRLPSQCKLPAGLMYLIDCSASMTEIFEDAKAFAATLMSGFEMPAVKQGALCFGTQVLVDSIIPLEQFVSYVELYINFVQKVEQDSTSLNTGTFYALEMATDMFNSLTSVTEKVIIVLTDGKSHDLAETREKAQEARAAGIQLIAIGVGTNTLYAELLDITGNADLVFEFANADLYDVTKLQLVQEKICELTRPGECLAGNYRDSQTMECKVCPQGLYQPSAEQLFCIQCPIGQTTFTFGSIDETDCIDKCPAGTFYNGVSCTDCPIGEYQPAIDQLDCLICPTDRPITEFTGATSVDDCKSDKCPVDMDLVLVVDCTASIGSAFIYVKAFLINKIGRFVNIRISVVRIADETLPQDTLSLTESINQDFLVGHILGLTGGASKTNTASAIKMATSILDNESVGTREHIPKIIFIITDGRSWRPFETKYEAILAKEKGYYLAVLGIGTSIFVPELRRIASEEDKVIFEPNFQNLQSLDVSDQLCAAADEWTPIIIVQDVPCDVAMDIVLVMDLSQSNTLAMMMKAKLENFIRSIPMSVDKVRVGIVSYGSVVNEGQKWLLSTDTEATVTALWDQPSDTELGTLTGLALKAAREMLLTDQLERVKSILVITNGASTDYLQTIQEAALVHESGIYAGVVGIGAVFMDELIQIADTGSNSVILVDSIINLTNEQLIGLVCPENFACSYKLHVTYIWFLSNSAEMQLKTIKFSKDLSERFEIYASVIEVGTQDSTAANMIEAIQQAHQQMSNGPSTNTIRNILTITDLDVSDIGTAQQIIDFGAEITAAKNDGIKITIINAGSDVGWTPYASADDFVFNEADFDEKLPTWHIQRSLCQEPCLSGSEIQMEGECGECEIGEYRDNTLSYNCVECSEGTTTVSTGSGSSAECNLLTKCDVPMDLIFAIDATASIGEYNFGLLRGFFWALVEWFLVGQSSSQTRIGIVKIGEEVRADEVLWLSESVDEVAVRRHILGLDGREQSTNTAAAIHSATDIFVSEGRSQKDYPYILVVATDGKSINNFQTYRASAVAQLQGIVTLAIALGNNVYMPEIRAIASKDSYVYQFDTFDNLINSNFIHDRICEAARQYVNDDGGTDPKPDILGECKADMDMVFVVDSSYSISLELYFKMKIFIIHFAELLDIGPDKIRLGIVAFSDDVHTGQVFDLEDCRDITTLTSGVLQQSKSTGVTTNTAAGLAAMIDMFERQGRPNSPYIAVVMTDGKSGNPSATAAQAQVAKDKGIHVVVIGFGSSVSKDELYVMGTDDASVRLVDNFDDLTTQQLLGLSCAYNFKCEEKMDIIALWDLENFDVITRAEKFIRNLVESFPDSQVKNVFVDHVEHVGFAMDEGRLELEARPPSESTRVLVVITDKTLDDTVKAALAVQATAAKESGIIVVVVDALETNNIGYIASNTKLSFTTNIFDVLPFSLVIQRSLCIGPCSNGYGRIPAGNCEECPIDEYRDAPVSFDCEPCPDQRITLDTASTSVLDCLNGVCLAPMDIIFVIDSSSSILLAQFVLLKTFLYNTIAQMDIGRTRVGLVPFNSDVIQSLVSDLSASISQEELLSKVIELQRGAIPGTNTARAIDVGHQMFITQGRQDVTYTMVVITDGISLNTYKTGEESEKAQKDFIRMFALGVGGNINKPELVRIASDESSLLEISSFFDLAANNDFLNMICEESFVCSSPMDVVLIEDDTPDAVLDTDFVARKEDFYQKMATSYQAPHTVVRMSYLSMTDLNHKLPSLLDMSTNPEKAKVFLFVSNSDIDNEDAKSKVDELREAGGTVAIINANDAVGNGNFITMASKEEIIFETGEFNAMPAYRYIERKLCTDACEDGYERSEEGDCTVCSVGTYRTATDSHQCLQCDPGETTQTTGADSATLCIPACGPGSRRRGSSCVDCMVGTYQPDWFQSSCIDCAVGFTTVTTGSTLSEECLRDCPAGFKISADGQTCESCLENSYQPEPLQTECTSCPLNLITEQVESTSLDQCIDECGEPMDIVFVVDASSTLTLLEFTLIKGFVSNSIDRLNVGPTDTRVGIVEYSDEAAISPRLDLQDTVDRNHAKNIAMGLAKGIQPGTDMADGISDARTMIEQQGRSGVPKTIIVVSARPSDDSDLAKQEASSAKDSFIQVMSVGVGLYDEDELQDIATDGTMFLTASNFVTLLSLSIVPSVCTAKFVCAAPMDIYYIKHYGPDPALEGKVTQFLLKLENLNSQETLTELSGGVTLDAILTTNTPLPAPSTPEHSHVLIIFTNQPPADTSDAEIAATTLQEQGVVVAVVYNDDSQADDSFDNIATDLDLMFFKEDFEDFPFAEFIVRSLCLDPCVDGHERGVTVKCTPCEVGTYRTATDTHACQSCGPGFTTATTGSTQQSQCESTQCTAVEWECNNGDCIPVDQYCDDVNNCVDRSDEDCNKCPVGSKWNGNNCDDCERGTFQSLARQTECRPCPEGTTTAGVGADEETDCNIVCDEDGREINVNTGQCVDCPLGEYRNKDFYTVCVSCRDKFTTAQTASTSIENCVPDCLLGTSWSDDDDSCIECFVNFYQDKLNQYTCEPCPDGTTTQTITGATQQSQCISICDDGYYLVTGGTEEIECETCPVGTYRSDPDNTCQSCQDGFTTVTTASTDPVDCVPGCGPTEYYDDVTDSCLKCAAGTYQDEPFQRTCKTCPPGTTTQQQGSLLEDDCIVPCPGGEILAPDGICDPCEVGTYRPDDDAEVTCTECSPGYTTNDEGASDGSECILDCGPGMKIVGTTCEPCEQGSYQLLSRQTSCVPCELYTSTLTTGADNEDLCIDPCNSGSELFFKSPITCLKCAKDFHKEKGVDLQCQACPSGLITLGDGATSQEQCLFDCIPGEKWDYDTKQCVDCPVGTFQYQYYADTCILCPDGWTTLVSGSDSLDDCIPNCGPGFFWDEWIMDCEQCEVVEYQPQAHQSVCLPCPDGTITNGDPADNIDDCQDICGPGKELPEGGTTVADCVACPKGSYNDASSYKCVPCDDGFTTATDGSTLSIDCEPDCPAGYYWVSLLGVCEECPLNKYQNAANQWSCIPCDPAGYITIDYGSDDITDCVSPCGPGYAWGTGTCEPCNPGDYQDLSNQDSCKPCPTPLTSLISGATECIVPECGSGEYKCADDTCVTGGIACDTVTDCGDGSDEATSLCCELGQFRNTVTDTCDHCDIGTYQDMIGKTSCIPCPAGWYTTSIKSDDLGDCVECLPGLEFVAGGTTCTECPQDTYRASGMAKCKSCPDDHITLTAGSTSILLCLPECGLGEYFNGVSCVDCQVGFYQDDLYQSQCDPCPVGQTTTNPVTGAQSETDCEDICPDGETLIYDSAGVSTQMCEPCDVGEIKVTSLSSTCQLCPSGFTTAGPGSILCIPNCGPGTFYPSITSSICTTCLKGQHQAESLQSSCDSCPPGQTTATTGSVSSTHCFDPCSSGYEYNVGGVGGDSCDLCASGSYRTQNVHAECESCKSGFTTPTSGAESEIECVHDCIPGQFYDELDERCESCEPGWYQSLFYQYVCIRCPAGTTSLTSGATQCQDLCGPGYETQADGTCNACPIGTIKYPGSTVCSACQDKYTTDPSVPRQYWICVPNCPAGQFWDGTKCSLCPKGMIQPAPFQEFCIPCDNGLTTVEPGADDEDLCIDICPSGFELQYTGTCVECIMNYYRVNGETIQCVACPGDFITLFDGADSLDECLPVCDAGYYWNDITKQCEPCTVGTYQSKMHQRVCIPCGAGMTTIDLTGVEPRPVTGATSEAQCVGDCTAGSFWNDPTDECELCHKGTYQNIIRRDTCVTCPPGYTTPSIGTVDEDDCFDPCPSGYTYTNLCEPCGFHRYRDRAIDNVCQDCDPALITLTSTATSETLCRSRCGAGYEWIEALLTCEECQIGYYQPLMYQMTCLKCDNDWTTLIRGSTQEADCLPPCTFGEEWSKVEGRCVYCPVGFYQELPNQPKCTPCPTGKSTYDVGSILPTQCVDTTCDPTDDWICTSGAIECGTRCNNVRECVDRSDEIGCNCAPGRFYDFGVSSCRRCPIGQYQDEPAQFKCRNCPVGFTSAAGSDSLDDCIDLCNDGEEYDTSTGVCNQCVEGTYRKRGELGSCRWCPAKFTTENPGATDQAECIPDCPAGWYYNTVISDCALCPIGQYEDLPHKYSCELCPIGKTTIIIGATSIIDCIDVLLVSDLIPGRTYNRAALFNSSIARIFHCSTSESFRRFAYESIATDIHITYVCPEGQELAVGGTTPAQCIACPQGSFKDSAEFQRCLDCDPGFTTAGAGTTSRDQCIPECELGEGFTVGNTGCEECQRGYYNDNPLDGVCDECPPGETTEFTAAESETVCDDLCNNGFELSADRLNCEPCQWGFYRSQYVETECQSCPAGQTTPEIGAATIDECVYDCEAGEWHNIITGQCELCEVGTYQNLPHQTTCKDCPSWMTTVAEGTDSIDGCIDKCASGYEDVSDTCEECPRGSYRTAMVHPTCQDCRDGFTTLSSASTSALDCFASLCGPGTHWDEVTDTCIPCEEGTFNPDPYQLECEQCPPDKPLSDDDYLACKADCPPGEAWNRLRQICNWCQRGEYKSGGSGPCVSCPGGYTTLNVGSTSPTDCYPINCAIGFTLDPPTATCIPCPVTTHRPDISQPYCLQCVGASSADRTRCLNNCELGEKVERVAGIWTCVKCDQSSYQDEINQPTCKQCPNSWHTKDPGATSASQCQADWCDPGWRYNTVTTECEECGQGYYRADTDAECLQCPTGLTTYTLTAPSISSCMTCGPGSRIDLDSESCQLCNKRSYQDLTNQLTCKLCPNDWHVKNPGATNENMCQADWCDAGYQYNVITTLCEPCGTGFYRTDVDAVCLQCPPGQTTHTPTAPSSVYCTDQCQAGYWYSTITTKCEPCGVGFYRAITDTTCLPCPTGTTTTTNCATSISQCSGSSDWCQAGYWYSTITTKCEPCGVGFYRAITDTTCLPCPTGTTTTTNCATSISQCSGSSVTCGPGSKIDLDSGSCQLCDTNSYQDLANQLTCKPCPNGWQVKKPGATNENMCQADWCQAGYWYSTITTKCEPCGVGFYRAITDTTCLPCPTGTTTTTNCATSISQCSGSSGGACPTDFNLVIAVDLSNNANATEIQSAQNYLKDLLQRLPIGKSGVHVGIVKYASRSREVISLRAGCVYNRIAYRIDNNFQGSTSSVTNTVAGLHDACNLFWRVGSNLSLRPMRVLLITDNTSSNTSGALAKAQRVKDKGIHISAIGTNSSEVNSLASSADDAYVITDYTDLPPVDDVLMSICP